MPGARPTPQQIRDRVSAEIVRVTGGAAAVMRRSVEWVLARMVAVASHELHGHLSWILRQVLVDQADDAELERHAGIWGIARRPASRARGQVSLAGVAGAAVAEGTELRRADDARFLVDAPTAIPASGTVAVTVTAIVAGAGGNTAVGTGLQLVAPVSGIRSPATVTAALQGGLDAELDPSLRARTLSRIQEPPHGGARHDYVAWVRAVVGDAPVWVYPARLGPGTVSISFVMPDGSIPPAATVAAVQRYVDQERPVTAEATVVAPVPQPLNMRIRLVPDTAATRAAVAAELAAMIIREAAPGETLSFSRLSVAISAAAGEYSHNLLEPAGDVPAPFGRIVRLGAITWVVP